MSFKLPFGKYEIYHLAVDLSLDANAITKSWPADEKFGMISQIRRASTSVGANIAEGTSRFSEKEKTRFIEISYGSLMEVAYFLFMAQRLAYITSEQLYERKPIIEKLANKINTFYKRLNTNNQ
ncbi:MAG: four helix bundle protein [Halioglobus sp.]|jgi:four helix bundle protein